MARRAKDIFDQLKREHKTLKDILSKTEDASVSKRKSYLKQIEEELVPHARGEEKTLYALLYERSKDQDKEKALKLTHEAYEEHLAVDKLLADLKKIDVNHETWLGKFMVIKENIEHHIKEEEEDLFAKARQLVSEDEYEQLLDAYIDAKEGFSESMPTQGQIAERTPSEKTQRLQ